MGKIGKIGVGVPTVGEERSQRRISRSEPRSHHREWDAQSAVPGLIGSKVSTMRQVLGVEK
jgi:hypothetical protein